MRLFSYFNNLRLILKQKSGLDIRIKRFTASSDPDLALVRLLNHFKVDLFLDIGANEGYFAETLLKYGFKGKIVSFEPASDCHETLLKKSKKNANWIIAPKIALGSKKETKEINISANNVFNSFIEVDEQYAAYNKSTAVVDKESVEILPLDDVIDDFANEQSNIFVKIDTQGFEKEVLDGAHKTIARCLGIKIEMPLNPIYQNVNLKFYELIDYLKSHRFYPYQLYPVAINQNNGVMYEVDGVFFKKDD